MPIRRFLSKVTIVSLLGTKGVTFASSHLPSLTDVPPPPEPEPIEITELPLPPVAPSDAEGSCSYDVNPLGTGCIRRLSGLVQGGGFLPDNKYVAVRVNFTGAPAAPDPASIYSGDQLIIVSNNGTNFSNGAAWKCLTCGVPEANAAGRHPDLDYPQAFHDGHRVLAGANIVDCGDFDLTSDECTPQEMHIYPIRWNNNPDGSGPGGTIRELRLHPDNVHLGYNSFVVSAGKLNQYGYLGRLVFNPSPSAGEPLSARYDLVNVTILHSETADQQPFLVQQDQLRINPVAISVGELRGFSGTGKEVTYVGYSAESSNIDVFAVDLTTGTVRRITQHPEYCDPIDVSPDDNWSVIMDTRGSDRQMFMAGMRHVPPIIDLISTEVASSTRNNGQRRFFQPYLLDRYGDRGTYFGQQINGGGDGSPGSLNDPDWNGKADPKWSPDGTSIVYWQSLVVAPACGGDNPLPCPNSTEPGARTERLFIARLTSRTPLAPNVIEPISDEVPWGTKYVAGMGTQKRPYPPQGNYTLVGKLSGSASVAIVENTNKTAIQSIAVAYSNYSDVPSVLLNGWENVTVENPTQTLNIIHWFSDLAQVGSNGSSSLATKKTSSDGFHLEIDVLTNIFKANGTLETTIDGKTYKQPANGT